MKRSDVDFYEKIIAQLNGLYQEITNLAKKKPNDALNTFKLKFVNSTLDNCNKMLNGIYKPFPDFELFSEEDVPSNSDVTFILTQYMECIEKFRSDNIKRHGSIWIWCLEKSDEIIRTIPPKKLSE
jgi:tRNA splicing ligase